MNLSLNAYDYKPAAVVTRMRVNVQPVNPLRFLLLLLVAPPSLSLNLSPRSPPPPPLRFSFILLSHRRLSCASWLMHEIVSESKSYSLAR